LVYILFNIEEFISTLSEIYLVIEVCVIFFSKVDKKE